MRRKFPNSPHLLIGVPADQTRCNARYALTTGAAWELLLLADGQGTEQTATEQQWVGNAKVALLCEHSLLNGGGLSVSSSGDEAPRVSMNPRHSRHARQ